MWCPRWVAGELADCVGDFVESAAVPVAAVFVGSESQRVGDGDRSGRLRRRRDGNGVDVLDDLISVADADDVVPCAVGEVGASLDLAFAEAASKHARGLSVLLDFELDLAAA